MDTREDLWREYVKQYDIDVPDELIENEENFISLDIRHRIKYQVMAGGSSAADSDTLQELQNLDIHEQAVFEAKSDLVIKSIQKEQDFSVTQEELETAAADMAKRLDASPDMIRTFFGDDLSMLKTDLLKQKAIDWAIGRAEL
ncbi:MAG: hypothetical protein LUE90_04135 [Clostridiales bacterium]|nr:hypothetical protein [Clostridiales bacterium]